MTTRSRRSTRTIQSIDKPTQKRSAPFSRTGGPTKEIGSTEYDREQFPTEDPDEETDPGDDDYEPHPYRPIRP